MMNKIETSAATIDDVESQYKSPAGAYALPQLGYKSIFNEIFTLNHRIHYALLTRVRRDDCNTSTQNQ